MFNLCKGELKTHFTKPAYTLNVSMYQMTVLLQFNSGDSFSFHELQRQSQMPAELLKQVLSTLLKPKLLTGPEDPDQGDVFALNTGFHRFAFFAVCLCREVFAANAALLL